MSSKKNTARAQRETTKKIKKKTSVLVTEKVEYVDYKDVNLLQRFVSDRSKIRGQRVTGNDVQQQRDVANAIKNAREMALMPYTKRVAQTRTSRGSRDGDDRRSRASEATAAEAGAVNEQTTDAPETAVETTETEA